MHSIALNGRPMLTGSTGSLPQWNTKNPLIMRKTERKRVMNRFLCQMVFFCLVFAVGVLNLLITLRRPALATHKVRSLHTLYFDTETQLPSKGCFSRADISSQYVNHWKEALRLLQVHAPETVKDRFPETLQKNESVVIFPDGKGSELLRRYLRFRYSSFFPGYTILLRSPSAKLRQTMYYSRVWKAANDAIRENLARATNANAAQSWKWLLRSRSKSATIVTFVREPAERWVSAYNELQQRWVVENKYDVAKECPDCIFPHFDGEERVWAFLVDLLTLKLVDAFEIVHVYPESGILRASPHFDFLGKIETFEKDWKRLMDKYVDNREYVFDSTLGQHNSSKDVMGARKAGLSLLEHSLPFVQILEHILFKDYRCFGYPMRSERFGNASRSSPNHVI